MWWGLVWLVVWGGEVSEMCGGGLWWGRLLKVVE